jgi:hypothetical protein
MMRYVYEATEGATRPIDFARQVAADYETGGASEGEEEVAAPATTRHRRAGARRSESTRSCASSVTNAAPAAPAPPIPAPPPPPALRIPRRGIW